MLRYTAAAEGGGGGGSLVLLLLLGLADEEAEDQDAGSTRMAQAAGDEGRSGAELLTIEEARPDQVKQQRQSNQNQIGDEQRCSISKQARLAAPPRLSRSSQQAEAAAGKVGSRGEAGNTSNSSTASLQPWGGGDRDRDRERPRQAGSGGEKGGFYLCTIIKNADVYTTKNFGDICVTSRFFSA